jgi:cobaltochelatase CobT
VTITDAEQLGGAMMDRLAELFDEDAAPTARKRERKGRRLVMAR